MNNVLSLKGKLQSIVYCVPTEFVPDTYIHLYLCIYEYKCVCV